MGIFTGMSELELVERFIDELYKPKETVYADEKALSDAFDAMVGEMKLDRDTLEDETAMSEMFSNWTDAEYKEGNLHSAQYDEYCYVGSLFE